MKMTPQLRFWCERMLPRVRRISPALSLRYGPRGSVQHYWEVAALLEGRFLDEVLAQSAFLHGVPGQELAKLALHPDVLAVLDEREKLRALNVEHSEDVYQRLLVDALPSLRYPRSIVLLILEQLHHLDPKGIVARWSRRFRSKPGPLPRGMPATPSFKDRDELLKPPTFFSNVVAPAAGFFGFWRERNVMEDATLYYFYRDRFEALLRFAMEQSGPAGECHRLVALIADALGDLDTRVRWEWRHIGSLDRKLRQGGVGEWKRHLHRAGFVTVVCAQEEDCYRGLHRLHSSIPYRPTELEDTIGRPTLAGYRALHTILTEARSDQLAPQAIAVRLLPARADAERMNWAGRSRLAAIEKRLRLGSRLGLQVFAPDGRGFSLPVGSTVLDFACVLNHRWIAHLAGATVNRQPVHVLHHLRPGDVVWLNLSAALQPLPAGWEEKTHADHVHTIKREFRRFYRPALEGAGRRWLIARLFAHGIVEPPEDQLDALLQDAVASLRHFQSKPSSRWLLQQLGMLASVERGENLPFNLVLDAQLAHRIARAVVQVINEMQLVTLNDFEIPSEMVRDLDQVVLCTECEPSIRHELAGVLDGRVLRVHSAGSACARGGFPLSRSHVSTRPQYIVIETLNRVGAAAEVCSVFHKHQVNIIDLVGGQLGTGWSVIRVQLDYPGQSKLAEILDSLRAIPSVGRVVGPDEHEVPLLEFVLPPRRPLHSSEWSPAPPYICGNAIADDLYFYGMQKQKGLLRRVYDETLNPRAHGGRSVFIYGPKRVGKTSLARCFLREVDNGSAPVVTVYYEAAPGLPWLAAERCMAVELVQRAQVLAHRRKVTLPEPDSAPLIHLVRSIQSLLSCSVVLVIDEAVGLMEASRQAGEQQAVVAFRAEVEGQTGLLVLWIGPEAPALRLPEDLRHVLRRSELLPVGVLSLDDTRALLKAEKLSPRYQIGVADSVTRLVHRLTAGNPYWVSLLGRAMWELAPWGRNRSMQYTREILGRAKGHLFELGLPFEDRRSLEPSEAPAVAARILHLLAGYANPAVLETTELSEQAIHDGMRGSDGEVTVHQMAETLEEMRARGSLICEMRESKRIWRIAAPLLAEYLIYMDHGGAPA